MKPYEEEYKFLHDYDSDAFKIIASYEEAANIDYKECYARWYGDLALFEGTTREGITYEKLCARYNAGLKYLGIIHDQAKAVCSHFLSNQLADHIRTELKKSDADAGYVPRSILNEMDLPELTKGMLWIDPDMEVDCDIGQEVTMETTELSIPGHAGTWYAVDQREIDGHSFFLMEPSIHEDDPFNIVVDQNGELIMSEVYNGFDDRVMDTLGQLVAPVPIMPDDSISIQEMKDYGYKWGGMLPLREEAAQKLSASFDVLLLHSDDFESLAASNGMEMYEGIIHNHAAEGGIFGITKKDWLIHLEHPRLFVDMDGTLARFHDEVQYLERMYEPGFFRDLQPFRGAVETIREYMRLNPDTAVFILSSAIPGEPPGCERQKQAWLDKYLPEIDQAHRLFPEIGTDKSAAIPGGIRATDVLLDDYNKNLEEWRQAGGVSVKFVNNINDKALRGERWNGERIYHNAKPENNAKFLTRMSGVATESPTPKRGIHI